jgi:hypothetical protein
MASAAKHRQQAESNEQFAHELLTTRQHIEWAPVVIFYAAHHYVRAYLVTHPAIPRKLTHELIFDLLSTIGELKPALMPYSSLFNQCNEARYSLYTVYPPVVQGLIDRELVEVKAIILPLLSV